jgi:hypothetical protein
MIWQYNSKGKYSVQFLYAIVNGRGVRTPTMWKIAVPSRVHIFLWLLANNKALTRDNHAKRRNLDDKTCVFCNEPESVTHTFFQCCVAQAMWDCFCEVTKVRMGTDFESVARFWLQGKQAKKINDICFHASQWTWMPQVTRRCVRMAKDRCLLQSPDGKGLVFASVARGCSKAGIMGRRGGKKGIKTT